MRKRYCAELCLDPKLLLLFQENPLNGLLLSRGVKAGDDRLLHVSRSADRQALPSLANRDSTTATGLLAYQALGMRSTNLVKPGWWVGTKFRYMFCYKSCRTIPLTPHTKWEHILPHFAHCRLKFFQKNQFQHGGLAMLNHAERVWELDTQNPRSNHRVMYPPCTIYPQVPAYPH